MLLGVITFRFRLHIFGIGKKLERTLHHKRCVCVFLHQTFCRRQASLLQRKNASSCAAHLLAPACFSCACLKLFLLGFLSLVR